MTPTLKDKIKKRFTKKFTKSDWYPIELEMKSPKTKLTITPYTAYDMRHKKSLYKYDISGRRKDSGDYKLDWVDYFTISGSSIKPTARIELNSLIEILARFKEINDLCKTIDVDYYDETYDEYCAKPDIIGYFNSEERGMLSIKPHDIVRYNYQHESYYDDEGFDSHNSRQKTGYAIILDVKSLDPNDNSKIEIAYMDLDTFNIEHYENTCDYTSCEELILSDAKGPVHITCLDEDRYVYYNINGKTICKRIVARNPHKAVLDDDDFTVLPLTNIFLTEKDAQNHTK